MPAKTGEGPKFVMGMKTKSIFGSGNEKAPGPGQYDVFNATTSKIKNEPAFSMGSGNRADIANFKEK